ncbi:Stress-induced-phosphoprotein 1 [Seminavis robusta]|uniref:Stress-induced-phosphoprotein 1 n=1 Tax=Seminavis robusta TaxID=568900 RepID=A0A9N8E543_9STRA|nr:Stress-induced-phosphoprotein 1 [Seminavis robusta]|eukprot:Sro559_g166380.1 Stress-induced-phosphoprotein 1 (590) ;mRNA; f:8179-10108
MSEEAAKPVVETVDDDGPKLSAQETKTLGNEAFSAGEFAKAIDLYSKAIAMDEKNHVYYSNRAAAHLKAGDAAKALADANECLKLSEGSFLKGYTRKANALLALHRYNDASQCLQDGLAKFPNDPTLEKHLAAIKKERHLGQEKARASIVMTQSSQQKKAQKADCSMSDFVTITKANVELQILALKAQLELLNGLAEMSDDEKLDMLFDLLDKDRSGTINARELADGIRKRHEGMTFAEGLDRAIQMVAIFDEDGDARLNRDEFKKLIDAMLAENGVTFHQLSEFLILQLLFSPEGNNPIEELVGAVAAEEIDEQVKETSEFFRAATDDRMMALFRLFDMDGDGTVSFSEIALGLFKLSNSSIEDSTNSAVELLIMVEKDDSRELDFESFTRLILNFCAVGGMRFDEVADGLTILMCQPTVMTEQEMAQLLVADEMYSMAKDFQDSSQEAIEVMDALSYGKMHKLFTLWDENNDGALDYEELLKGMRKYQSAMDIDESVQRAALAMLAFDQDGNQKLDKEEFAHALTKFARGIEVDLHELIDFLVIVSALSDNDPMESAYIKAIAPKATAEIKSLQNLEDNGVLVFELE